MSTHQYQLIATGVLLEFKLANCQQWGLLAEEQWVYPPLTPPNELLCVVAIHETASNTTTPLANELGTVRFKIHNDFSSGNDGTNKARCIIVCR